jgi:hypothetical protein
MKCRAAVLTLMAALVPMILGGALQGHDAPDARSGGARRRQPARAEPRKPPGRQEVVPPGPGTYLAFDVRPADRRITTRYVLEITHPSGERTLHDCRKPPLLQRRTILVRVPSLEPGEYTLVVIAEGPGGASRSAPIPYDVKAKQPLQFLHSGMSR